MKKFLALALVAIMCLSLTACANTENGDDKEAKGSVYYLNFKPEADSAWQELAKTYKEKTGVEVKVLTAASNEYNNTLIAEMDKSNAPTLFQVGNQSALKTWGSYCYDLKDTDFYKEMTTDDFNIKGENGEIFAAGYCYEAFGIIVNKALLSKAGYTLEDITDFDSLKKVADDIHTRAAELGFDAFSSAGLESSSSWRFSGHLTNMPLFYEFRDDKITSQPAEIKGTYLDNYKKIWDLYTTDSATTGAALLSSTGEMSTSEFKQGRACFYQNGSWEYAGLIEAGLKADDLAMIPIYCGVDGEKNSGLCCGTENCWAVNKTAKEEDIKATLDFMYWVVTSDEGTTLLANEFGPCPFKNAKEPENVFFKQATEYLDNGNYTVTWAFNHTPSVDNWRAGVVDALSQYTASGGSWDAVKTAFVDGWATNYKVENNQ